MNKSRIHLGHLARKRFGQHFLNDEFTINAIVSIIDPKKDQAMVEIGPGLAALTKPICARIDHLTVIEIDHDLSKWLQTRPFLEKKLTIYQKDVMTINFSKLSKKLGRSLRVFGSLPYAISTALIFHIFKYINIISDMHFILQKEIVDRLIAKLDSKEYGRLSILAQYYCNISPLLEISPNAFTPQPKVNSTVVRLVPHTVMPYFVKEIRVLRRVTTKAFSHRRKMISNSLKSLFTIEELKNLEIDPTLRAENISIAQYCRMANYVSDNISNKGL